MGFSDRFNRISIIWFVAYLFTEFTPNKCNTSIVRLVVAMASLASSGAGLSMAAAVGSFLVLQRKWKLFCTNVTTPLLLTYLGTSFMLVE